ncbi:hypothetical protein, conserved [Leishmania tarentolae]|uniref:AB hydrolase-1 domain-containing protein n=1 Tax=Leishmania tarentolae TaxID=5689 RepID=A0A640KG20_LEITA|nr:hypothetical protein, conserved [Leishmania tarentolae]
MYVAHQHCEDWRRDQHAPENTFQRKPPRRKHFYSWVATDKAQLEKTEKFVLRGLDYHQAKIAGLNTISTEDISELDDNAVRVADLGGIANSNVNRDRPDEQQPSTPLSLLPAQETAAKEGKEIIILIHGFAGGVAAWAQNWRFLSEHYRVYAFDLPGFARSEHRASTVTSLPEAVDYFSEYIHRWFERLSFREPVIVLAHSFGCFVASHYAMRSGAETIKLLLLAEPWGLVRGNASRLKKYSLQARVLLRIFYNIGLLGLLRGVGPVGPWLLRRARPDFEERWCNFLGDPSPMYDYLYHCNAQGPPVGEKVFRVCCHYDACAKESLLDVLPDRLDSRIGVGLLFGGKSWLNTPEGPELAALLRDRGVRVCLYTLENASHQIFMDEVEGFNTKVVEMITELSSDLCSTPSV